MPVYYGYTNTIFGTQSTVNGAAHDYRLAPANGSTWQWTGTTTNFHVRENIGASNYNGDPTNEQVSAQEQIGGTWEQVTEIDGTYYQTIWDYTFEISSGGTTYRVAVIDVDLNNDDDLNDTIGGANEDGYYLVFPDGVPPAGTNFTVGNIVENDNATPHAGLGANTVCYAAGTRIGTANGDRPVESLQPGDLLCVKDKCPQPLLWVGHSRVPARGADAPVVIRKGALGNRRDLVVSAQHCVLIENYRAELLFGEPSVLVRAKDLVDGRAIYRRPGGWISYHHLLVLRHELVFSTGIPGASFRPGPQGMATLSDAARARLFEAMPSLRDDVTSYGRAARPSLKRHEARWLMTA